MDPVWFFRPSQMSKMPAALMTIARGTTPWKLAHVQWNALRQASRPNSSIRVAHVQNQSNLALSQVSGMCGVPSHWLRDLGSHSSLCGAAQADVGILIISARKSEFEAGSEGGGQTREHALLAKTLKLMGGHLRAFCTLCSKELSDLTFATH